MTLKAEWGEVHIYNQQFQEELQEMKYTITTHNFESLKRWGESNSNHQLEATHELKEMRWMQQCNKQLQATHELKNMRHTIAISIIKSVKRWNAQQKREKNSFKSKSKEKEKRKDDEMAVRHYQKMIAF
jgi:hypothetical protein